MPWKYVISNLKEEETVGTFYENELQKTNQKDFRIEKVIKRKFDNLYVIWKGYDSSLNSCIHKKTYYKWVNIFQNQNLYGEWVKVESDLSNYATKTALKNVIGTDTSLFPKKTWFTNLKLDTDKLKKIPTNLNNLKSKADELNLDKLIPIPIDLTKLSNAVKNDVVKIRYI